MQDASVRTMYCVYEEAPLVPSVLRLPVSSLGATCGSAMEPKAEAIGGGLAIQ